MHSFPAGAMVCSSFFERRLWCRHLCPIGGMNGLFAKLSMTELRAHTGICAGEHNPRTPGIPMAKGQHAPSDRSALLATVGIARCGMLLHGPLHSHALELASLGLLSRRMLTTSLGSTAWSTSQLVAPDSHLAWPECSRFLPCAAALKSCILS